MGHSAGDHLEHAEHAAHASHDDFDKQVTISIAIVAAVLAAVTMFGHRSHNETLQLQNEALRLQNEALQERTEAGNHHIESSDQWNFYQAQNIRKHQYEQSLGLLEATAAKSDESTTARIKSLKDAWQKQVAEYKAKLPKIKETAESEKETAKKHAEASNAKLEASNAKREESHGAHDRSMRFDLGELGLQLGVVLCSLSILTKRRGFWFMGLLSALAGAVVALTGILNMFMGGGHH